MTIVNLQPLIIVYLCLVACYKSANDEQWLLSDPAERFHTLRISGRGFQDEEERELLTEST